MRKKTLAALLAVVLCLNLTALLVFAEGIAPGAEWSQTFGGTKDDMAHSVQQTTDGGYILAGVTDSIGLSDDFDAGDADVYLVKTDSNGDEEWSQTFGGTNADGAYSGQQTTDGGYILAGWTFSLGANNRDAYLIKTDSNGGMEWSRTFGGTGHDIAVSVQQTTDGGYILAGWTWSFGAGCDAYLIKTYPSGDEEWSQTFGGENDDAAYSVQQTTDGGYIVAGMTESFGAGDRDAYLIKTDSDGNVVWNKTFGGTNWDRAYSVQQTTDGGYILVGHTESFGAGGADVYLVKTDSIGQEEWSQTFGGANADRAHSVQQTTDGGYILAGDTDLYGDLVIDAYLIKTDSSGEAEWSQTFGGTNGDIAVSVQQTTDGGYILAGATDSFGAGGIDVYLVKVASAADAGGPYLAQVGLPVTLDGSGSSGVITSYDWVFGDGETGTGVLATHTYNTTGLYTAELTVTNDRDIQYTDSAMVVVYDPEAGFIAGGGWIDSPEGAYLTDPSLTGKANFGFVSKYKKGATVPTGQTEFQFKTGGLNFHSSSYDWLVVTGSDYAKFKGTGTINGEGDYKFMLWAGDGDPDTFRIKIWYEVGDMEFVVYDNGMNQPIGGGNIVIHR